MNAVRFLYIATHPNGLCKIGMTKDWEQRERALRNEQRADVRIVWVTHCDSLDTRAIEMLAHRNLADRRRHGEWFAIKVSEGATAIIDAINAKPRTTYERRPAQR
jgi:hypothetical protein